jgi:bacteriocin biosynthesis cyclodehydratase domain-containing protein
MLRPMLKPALSRTWRDHETLQFGAVAERAVVLDHVGPEVCAFLDLLDGSREPEQLAEEGERLGFGGERTLELLESLARAGLLDDAAAHGATDGPVGFRQLRFGPDLASLSLVHPAPGAAPALLADRRAAVVEVRGAGRVGSTIAGLLAAGGVGGVEVVDGGRVAPGDCSPGGLPPEDVGRLRATAAREAVRRAAGAGGRPGMGGRPGAAGLRGSTHEDSPSGEGSGIGNRGGDADSGIRSNGGRGGRDGRGGRGTDVRTGFEIEPAQVVVLAPRDGTAGLAADPEEGQRLLAAGVPHLYTGVVEHLGLVGPLVIPGASACGGCAAQHRSDRDPLWPRLVAQLCSDGPARARTPACDTALAAAVAGVAALHVLMLLDGGRPPSIDGVVELSAADGMTRRLRMPMHPECGCGWSGNPGPAGSLSAAGTMAW